MHLATIAQLSDASGTAAASKTIPVAVAAGVGQTLVLVVSTNALSAQDGAFTATDTQGNTWTTPGGSPGAHAFKSGTCQISVLLCTVASGKALTTSDSITVTHAAANVILWNVSVEAFDDPSGFDVVAINTGANTTPTSGPTAAGAQSNELLIVATVAGSTLTMTGAAGFSNSGQQTAAGSSTRNMLTQWEYVSTGGTRSGSATLSVSASWAQVIVVLKSSAPPQILVPDADITTASWVKNPGGSGGFYTYVDEGSTPDDTDFLRSAANPAAQVLELSLSPGVIPSDLTGHKLRARLRLNGSTGSVVLKLKEGSTVRAASGSISISPGVFAWYEFDLSSVQAGTIVDMTALTAHLEVTAAP